MQHEAALGLDRPAAQHLQALGLARQPDQLLGGDDVELDQKVGKPRIGRRLVDDNAHRAILGMGTDIDDAAAEAGIGHAGHRDQALPVEIAATADTLI